MLGLFVCLSQVCFKLRAIHMLRFNFFSYETGWPGALHSSLLPSIAKLSLATFLSPPLLRRDSEPGSSHNTSLQLEKNRPHQWIVEIDPFST